MSALNQLHKTQTKLLSHQGLDQNMSSTIITDYILWHRKGVFCDLVYFKAKVESFYTLFFNRLLYRNANVVFVLPMKIQTTFPQTLEALSKLQKFSVCTIP